MAFLRHLILCDSILVPITPGNSRKPTLHGVFQTIYASTFPVRHPSMAVAIQLSANPGKHEVKLRLVDSQGTDLINDLPPGTIEVTDEILGIVDINITLNGIGFPKPGIYSFEFHLDDEELGSRDFMVSEPPQAPPGGMPNSPGEPGALPGVDDTPPGLTGGTP